MKIARVIPLAVVLLLGLAFVVVLLRGGAAPPPSMLIDKPVPETPIAGLHTSDLQGENVLVNFFASWCATCADEQPALEDLAGQENLTLIGIAYKDEPARTQDWLQRHGNPFDKLGADPKGQAALDWGVYGVPETYLIQDGIVRWRHVGALDATVVNDELMPLLSEEEDD